MVRQPSRLTASASQTCHDPNLVQADRTYWGRLLSGKAVVSNLYAERRKLVESRQGTTRAAHGGYSSFVSEKPPFSIRPH